MLLATLFGLIAIAYFFAGPVTALWMAAEGGVWIGVFLFGDRYLERKRRDEEREFVAALEARSTTLRAFRPIRRRQGLNTPIA
ncbi:MAG TPA: hypothetical protein VEM77_06685 [Thermoplasmata archaeon]|nr:hypothetical protein [Thermoplasmata archaeon]